MYSGAKPMWMEYIIMHSLYCTRCFTGNQWSCLSDAVTCSHGFRLQTRRAAACYKHVTFTLKTTANEYYNQLLLRAESDYNYAKKNVRCHYQERHCLKFCQAKMHCGDESYEMTQDPLMMTWPALYHHSPVHNYQLFNELVLSTVSKKINYSYQKTNFYTFLVNSVYCSVNNRPVKRLPLVARLAPAFYTVPRAE